MRTLKVEPEIDPEQKARQLAYGRRVNTVNFGRGVTGLPAEEVERLRKRRFVTVSSAIANFGARMFAALRRKAS